MKKRASLPFAFCLSLVMAVTGCNINDLSPETRQTSEAIGNSLARARNSVRRINLIHVSSDATPGVEYDLRGLVDAEGTAVGLELLTTGGDPIYYDLRELTTGIVLMEKANRKIVTLISKNFDPKRGGTIEGKYLFEAGLMGDRYKSEYVEAEREGAGWVFYTNKVSGRKKFNHMFLRKNEKPIIGIVGISEIVFSFQNLRSE